MQDWDCVNKLRSHHPIRITIHNIPDIVTRWWKNIAAMLDDVASNGNDGGDGDEDVGTDVCNINSLSISAVNLYRSAFKKHCSDRRVKIPESIFQSISDFCAGFKRNVGQLKQTGEKLGNWSRQEKSLSSHPGGPSPVSWVEFRQWAIAVYIC